LLLKLLQNDVKDLLLVQANKKRNNTMEDKKEDNVVDNVKDKKEDIIVDDVKEKK